MIPIEHVDRSNKSQLTEQMTSLLAEGTDDMSSTMITEKFRNNQSRRNSQSITLTLIGQFHDLNQ